MMMKASKPYFGLRGGWLTFWITLACGADMTLYGYDQVWLNENFNIPWLKLRYTDTLGKLGCLQWSRYLSGLSSNP